VSQVPLRLRFSQDGAIRIEVTVVNCFPKYIEIIEVLMLTCPCTTMEDIVPKILPLSVKKTYYILTVNKSVMLFFHLTKKKITRKKTVIKAFSSFADLYRHCIRLVKSQFVIENRTSE
jgi:hypothetical protein